MNLAQSLTLGKVEGIIIEKTLIRYNVGNMLCLLSSKIKILNINFRIMPIPK